LAKSFSLIQLETSTPLSFVVQVSLGMMIGLSFTRLTKHQLKQIRDSLVFVVITVIAMTAVTGFIVSFITHVSRPISVISSAPGGMVEMATMASALELDAPSVIFLHFLRLLIVMLIYPQIIKYVSVNASSAEVISKETNENNERQFRLNLKSSSIKYI